MEGHAVMVKYNVVLVRSGRIGTTAYYLERALSYVANVIPVVVPDQFIVLKAIRRMSLNKLYTFALFKDVTSYIERQILKNGITPDVVIVVDPVRIPPPKGNWITAYYAIDCHLAVREHFSYAKVDSYDYVFVAQKDYIKQYREKGCRNVCWLPLAFDPLFHREQTGVERIYDIVFVGNVNVGDRRRFCEALKRRFPKSFVGKAWFHELSIKYSQGLIGFNKSVRLDVNMRVFEITGCRRLLLTDCLENGFNELYEVGKEVICYRSLEECLELAEYYIHNDEEREAIATRGYRRAKLCHTYLHRAMEMLKKFGLKVYASRVCFKRYAGL